MANDRLIAYQNPPGGGTSRIAALLGGRRGGSAPSHHRQVQELRDLFHLYGAGDRLFFTSSERDLPQNGFAVPLHVEAYFNLSPRFEKNATGRSIFEMLSEAELRALREREGNLLLSLLTEAFFPREEAVAELHRELLAWDIDPRRVLLVNNNLRSEEGYGAACAALGYSDRIDMVPFHGNYWLYVGRQLASGGSDAELEARAQASASTPGTGRRRSTKYVSFNGKIRPHRLVLVLFLMSRRVLDLGHVSLLTTRPNERLDESDLLWMLDLFPLRDELRPYVPELLSRVPLTLDIDSSAAATSMYSTQDPALYDDSYFSVVTDTLFLDASMLFLSEKPFKAIFNLHPFVYLGNPGALQELRNLGFETFSPFIDESYDQVDDHGERMLLALIEIERLAKLSLEELHAMYCELWPRLLRNYQHITQRAPQHYFASAQEMIWSRLGLSLFPARA